MNPVRTLQDLPPDIDLIQQHTIDPPDVERWVWTVEAPTKLAAKRRVRAATRLVLPSAKNILNPKALSRHEAEQTKMRDSFPEQWHRENFVVEVVVVK